MRDGAFSRGQHVAIAAPGTAPWSNICELRGTRNIAPLTVKHAPVAGNPDQTSD